MQVYCCCCCQIIRYQELHKTLLEKSEELQKQLDEQNKENKNTFIEAKKQFEDKGIEALLPSSWLLYQVDTQVDITAVLNECKLMKPEVK